MTYDPRESEKRVDAIAGFSEPTFVTKLLKVREKLFSPPSHGIEKQFFRHPSFPFSFLKFFDI